MSTPSYSVHKNTTISQGSEKGFFFCEERTMIITKITKIGGVDIVE